MSVNAVSLIREIRDRNYQITRAMTFADRLDFIHQKAAESEKRLKKQTDDLVEDQKAG